MNNWEVRKREDGQYYLTYKDEPKLYLMDDGSIEEVYSMR